TVIVKKDALITSTAAIVITATANASASLSSSTEREIKSLANPGGTQVAIAVAVSNAVANSHIDVAAGAVIEAGKTANLVAGGAVESEAEAESGMYADGSAGLAFAIELSKADITTVVNGTVIAHMTPCEDLAGVLTGCSTVKIEIDPLVTNIKDVGYVDYAYDRIHVGMHGLVTEDTVTYSPRRGSNIGGLVEGRTYFVVWMADDPTTLDLNESEFIALASSEQAAVRAATCSADGDDHAAYLAYLVCLQQFTVDLTQAGFPATTNNTRDFTAADVDTGANTVTLHWTGGVFNTFELGQAVVYHQKGSAKIEGLVDGATYYVVASTNQTNLQGNTRFADAQVIGLAETENEARGGVLIDIGPAQAGGYSFAAKHVLDTGFATGVGILSKLEAKDSSSAAAGLADTGHPVTWWALLKESFSGNFVNQLFDAAAFAFGAHAPAAGLGSPPPLAVAGALAVIDADHHVETTIGSTAVVKSGEDLEINATIAQRYTISANSSIEPQTDAAGGLAGSSADTAISVAVSVANFDNTAIATVKTGAKVDGLRATRVISDVSYPFLVRFDEYIPLSWSEFIDRLRSEGPDAVLKYLNTT
ncbi:MAG TPA: hypothetical protein VL916_00530, partial [Ilumatobacteraceae bacterium]|nr:hypothetical protein [Ilumatobacteraceae bacterium]